MKAIEHEAENNKIFSKKFCGLCGTKHLEVPLSEFNPVNGEKRTGLICPDRFCEKGCEYRGHDIPWFSTQCRRCKVIPYALQA